MVLKISDVSSFTKMLETQCDPNIEISGRWVKIITDSFCSKRKITNCLKEKKFQFYVVLDIEELLKIILRGFPKRISAGKC